VRVVVINTGTELLLGDVLNSHLAFIAREVFPIGLRIDRQIAVPDGPSILAVLEAEWNQAEILFITGGLGPTTDDLTREITAEFLGLELLPDPNVIAAISARAAFRGFRLTDRTARQAQVPRGAIVLLNQHGSAPGLYLVASGGSPPKINHLFLLPGPPRELQPMFTESVIPLVRKIAPQAVTARRTYRIAGMGESLVEEAVGERLLKIPGIEVGYCARPGEVDLRIIGQPEAITRGDAIIQSTLGERIFAKDSESLEEVVVRLLQERKQTLAVAESCTGGFLSHRITNVPGASAVFLAGYVTYANEAKSEALGVEPQIISAEGAVSKTVARAMAEGVRRRSNADWALATTGVAGPGGGTPEKPVGTVFVALAATGVPTKAKKLFFPDDRQTFKELTTQTALDLLRQSLLR
jgi:nicotinamide-nucleotide amidase